MKQRIRQITSNQIVQNLVSVGTIQGISLLLPLLTIPYLLQVLGAHGFGLVNLALAVVTYFVVFTDYGFNLMGTRLIALHRDKPAELNRIFSNMLYAQLLLTLAAVLLFLLLLWLVPDYRRYSLVFIATFGVVIGSTLFPTWFFQGQKKFNQMHIINMVYRALYTLGIFLFVKDENDLLTVPLLNSGTHILGGIFALGWVMMRYRLRFISWEWSQVTGFLREGWNLFVSAMSVTSLQQLPIIILGIFSTEAIVGYYAFADKILLLFRILVQLMGSVLYPRMIEAAQESHRKLIQLLGRVQRYGSILFLLVGIGLFFTPALIATFAPKYYSPQIEMILKIWTLLPLSFFLKITSEQVLLAYNHTRDFSRAMMYGALANLFLLLILSAWLGYSGTALAVLLTEVFLIFALQSRARNLAPKLS